MWLIEGYNHKSSSDNPFFFSLAKQRPTDKKIPAIAMLDLSLSLRISFSSQTPPLHATSRSLSAAPVLSFSRLTPQCSLATPSRAARPVPWGCEIESLESAYDLQKWLSDSGLPPQKMGIERVEVGERGLVALKNIRKGEKLLFVPPPLVITADSVSSFVYKPIFTSSDMGRSILMYDKGCSV